MNTRKRVHLCIFTAMFVVAFSACERQSGVMDDDEVPEVGGRVLDYDAENPAIEDPEGVERRQPKEQEGTSPYYRDREEVIEEGRESIERKEEYLEQDIDP